MVKGIIRNTNTAYWTASAIFSVAMVAPVRDIVHMVLSFVDFSHIAVLKLPQINAFIF